MLFIIANNARGRRCIASTLSTYPKGHAGGDEAAAFATLEPSPRFEHVIQASAAMASASSSRKT